MELQNHVLAVFALQQDDPAAALQSNALQMQDVLKQLSRVMFCCVRCCIYSAATACTCSASYTNLSWP